MGRKSNRGLMSTIFMVIVLGLSLTSLSFATEPSGPLGTMLDNQDMIMQNQQAIYSLLSEVRACQKWRFIDNQDGTVYDCRSGLIWMKYAHCLGKNNWYDSVTACDTLASGACWINDGSSAGDWRLPTIHELKILTDNNYSYPALSNGYGDNQWENGDVFILTSGDDTFFWSSTEDSDNPGRAWNIRISNADTGTTGKTASSLSYRPFPWCVRGEQGVSQCTDEVCDGLDNDCDGSIDDSVIDPEVGIGCGTGMFGICYAGEMQCQDGRIQCVSIEEPWPYDPCDGLDNDCDGTTDEGCP